MGHALANELGRSCMDQQIQHIPRLQDLKIKQKSQDYCLVCDFDDLLNTPYATTLEKVRTSTGPMKFILLSAHEQKFVESFLSFAADDAIIDRTLSWKPPPIKLTKRQIQILRLSAAGNNNRKIAEILNLSENTIKVHAWRLYKQIGAKNRLDAIAKARAQGYL